MENKNLDLIELKGLDGSIILIKMDLFYFEIGSIIHIGNTLKVKYVSEKLLEEIV